MKHLFGYRFLKEVKAFRAHGFAVFRIVPTDPSLDRVVRTYVQEPRVTGGEPSHPIQSYCRPLLTGNLSNKAALLGGFLFGVSGQTKSSGSM